jgi:hypothetical protein
MLFIFVAPLCDLVRTRLILRFVSQPHREAFLFIVLKDKDGYSPLQKKNLFYLCKTLRIGVLLKNSTTGVLSEKSVL